jgi:hypothetical protein
MQDSIKRIAEQDPSQFFVASKPAIFGTEEALEALFSDWGVNFSASTSLEAAGAC